ncbi:MAG: hypothetical protein WC471_00290 [Candidatus Woesearchaeota archaeon]
MKLIQNKKAQAEESINWVFVLMAGAVILLFFAMIIYRFGIVSEKQTDVTIVTNLNSILAGTELSSRFSTLIEDLPNDKEAYFDCNGFTIGGSTNSYQQKIVFAPSQLPLNPLRIWTLDWNMPYLVTNFVYLTSRKIQYVFVHDENSPLKSRIESIIPEDMNKLFLTDTSRTFNNCPTRYVFLDKDPVSLQDICATSTAVRINSDGTISYYSKNGNSFILEGQSNYFDDASLQAAIIADNAVYYECMMNKAFKRYKSVSYIIAERTLSLKNDPQLVQCNSHYNTDAEDLYRIVASGNFKTAFNEIKSLMTSIIGTNRQLPLYSCPTIY